NPPLRAHTDVRALWAGLVDRTVDAIATDHAPHASTKKDVEFDQAAFGISGLETAVPLVLGAVRAGWAPLATARAALAPGPARPSSGWKTARPGGERPSETASRRPAKSSSTRR